MRFLELHLDAADELLESSQYLDQETPGMGSRFLDDFYRVLERISEFPESGFRISGKVRGARVSVFHYDIVYKIERKRIYILAVAHQSRKPGYWRGRI